MKTLPAGREDVPWATMAAVLVIARLCEPSSELHIAEDWFRRTALDDLLDVRETKVNADRCYRALDQVLAHSETLQVHLKEQLGTLFGLEYDLVLYDVTSAYFEGLAEANPLAQRGYSRDHRSDCKQVCIGLVVTRDGFPLGFEVFAGNRHDSTTLREIVARMEERYGRAQRVWALDRGMVSEEHLDWLRERGSRYIVGTPKNQLRAYERQLLEGEWSAIRDGLQVQLVRGDDGVETFILCRSEERAAKEQAMRQRFAERIELGLTKLTQACERAPQTPGVIERRVGRLLERNQCAARFYDIRGRVALGRYRPRAPTDPYVRALAHTVPRPTGWPSTNGPRGYLIELRGHAEEPRCAPHVSLDQVCRPTLRFPSQGPPRRVPLLRRYYQSATTSCRPSRRTSLPSLGGTSASTRSFRSPADECAAEAWSW